MTGCVDGQLRALLRVPLAATQDGPRQDTEAWVDTAFNGGLAAGVACRAVEKTYDPPSACMFSFARGCLPRESQWGSRGGGLSVR